MKRDSPNIEDKIFSYKDIESNLSETKDYVKDGCRFKIKARVAPRHIMMMKFRGKLLDFIGIPVKGWF
jgi:hypothetical protein